MRFAPQLDEDARGVAPLAQGTVHVPGALPGEVARVRVVHVGVHGRSFGELLSVTEPSTARTEAGCPQFLRCGGCDLLHASADFQAADKTQRLRRALAALLPEDDARHRPILRSPQPLAYRALAKWVVGPGGTLGSYAPRSHAVVDMRGCRVHAPVLERIGDALRGVLSREAAPDLRYVLARAAVADDRVIVTLVVRDAEARTPRAVLPVLAADPSVARVVLHVNAQAGDALLGDGPDEVLLDRGGLAERLGDVDQDLDSGAFAQINPATAALLYAEVAAAIAPAGRAILDLYSGSGGIALTLAAAGARAVFGIEQVEAASRAATRSAARMGLADRTTFVWGPVEVHLASAPPADAIVLNPPRRGATPAVLAALRARAPVDLVYVSCDPRTLALDLEALAASGPLTLGAVTPVDMFPQTRHVEALVVARLG